MALPPAGTLMLLPNAALAGLACEAASLGDVEAMRLLVQAGVSANIGTPHDQRTPLHLAAASGNFAMAKFLMEECGATLQRDRFGLLPIHDAVQHGHVDLRRYLQGKKLHAQHEESANARKRSGSGDSVRELAGGEASNEMMSTVFELVVKEGVFSYTTVHSEVQHFFRGLALHPMYFEHFTPLQIAKHIHCLIAAKRVARATNHMSRLTFHFKSEDSGFFLTTIDCPEPTEAQKKTEVKVSEFLDDLWSGESGISLSFMASRGPLYQGGKERLGIFTMERRQFDMVHVAEDETSLEVLASAKFLKEKTRTAKEQYQVLMEDVVASRHGVVRIVPGSVYPGPYPGGFVLQFGTSETAGRHYFPEICQAMRFVGVSPLRFYMETFANGVITYSLFFPSAKEEQVRKLGRTIMYSAHLRSLPGRGDVIYAHVMEGRVSHEVGLYLLAAVKFVYTFFPKEQYVREYTTVHKVLENDPNSQRKLEALYKLCMTELLSTERIYDLIQRHLELAVRFFEDFKRIALGQATPQCNCELGKAIDATCAEPQDRQILRMFLTFNESVLMTNFFKAETPGAFAFRLNPKVVLKDRPVSLYPEIPYGIYLVSGRDFLGFHVRFRDVARGGIRLILSRDRAAYERSYATLFDEAYNLAFTQQMKNKDIPEGGAKGVILPDFQHSGPVPSSHSQNATAQRSCFTRYLDSLLDCMLPAQGGVYRGHMEGKAELLYFGPDENTANFMDLGAELARGRGYPYWKAITTGKSVKLGGVPHDTYGMTTASVHTYVTELLKALGEDEAAITKFQTGGPDGDLGSNEILVSKDKTIGIVDGSGVAYDPDGLSRTELVRLAKARLPINHFSRSFLGANGFLVTVDEVDVALPDGSTWRTGAELRDVFHLLPYATADLFVPCGGRPNAVNTDNVQKLFGKDGKPKFRMVVEGANLFFSDGARQVLEEAGVHVFKDASTNKGGVTSSSLEVFSALALSVQDHTEHMSYDPDQRNEPPEFYRTYVKQILEIVIDNAKCEFKAIWEANRQDHVPKIEATRRLSIKINRMSDSIQEMYKTTMSDIEKDSLTRSVLQRAVPPLMLSRLGLDNLLESVPSNYIGAMVGAWVASRFVYEHGINASEVSFYFFMRALTSSRVTEDGEAARMAPPRAAAKRPLEGDVADTPEPVAARPRLGSI